MRLVQNNHRIGLHLLVKESLPGILGWGISRSVREWERKDWGNSGRMQSDGAMGMEWEGGQREKGRAAGGTSISKKNSNRVSPEKHTVGEVFDLGLVRRHVLEPHRIPHQPAELAPHLITHTPRDSHGGDTTRLRNAHHATFAPSGLKQILRNLCNKRD